MKSIVTIDHLIGPWVGARAPFYWSPGRGTSIGLMEGSEILAGVFYEGYNRANIMMHVAAIPGRTWLNREFLWFAFYYPFVQLGCQRVTGVVAETNFAAREFDENLGFTLEAALKSAHPDGDLLVYRMMREDCRWLTRGKRRARDREEMAQIQQARPLAIAGDGAWRRWEERRA